MIVLNIIMKNQLYIKYFESQSDLNYTLSFQHECVCPPPHTHTLNFRPFNLRVASCLEIFKI